MEPYEGREPYIFISYARKDKERVLPYLDALSGAGYRVWYDKGIKAGEHWTETLVEKAEACAVFCPLFSEAFNASRFCFEETEYAYRKDKPIVPVYLEEMKPDDLRPLYRLLGSRQDLRLYQFDSPAQFAEKMETQEVFAPCKVPEWHKVGLIQWRFADGVLTIEKNERLPSDYAYAAIPSYQFDPSVGSSAPWMTHREKILSVEIGDNILTIGDSAFVRCESLTNVRIPDSVIEIGYVAFALCGKLTNVRIPDSVIEIGDRAFAGCESLTDVRISNRVFKIGNGTFFGCKSLTDVRIPNSVTGIDDFAFFSCESLTDVRIPDRVVKIGDSAFSFCKNLMDARISDGVVEIGDSAFLGCDNLTDVRIPDSVTKIGDGAFFCCNNLKSVEMPVGAEVGKDAFDEHTLVIRRKAP